MSTNAAIAASVADAIDSAEVHAQPYRYWLLRDILPRPDCDALAALPIDSPKIGETLGRRETNNATRVYFAAENQARFPVCAGLAAALQDGPAVAAIERATGTDLSGTSLRIEYCQDRDGFWLEPHTDIGAKRLTMLVYLSDDPGSADWGTDLMDEWWFPAGRAPYARNRGLMFVPGATTYHGFRRRPIAGIRRSLIVNYVGPEWRARHELAFPERPLRARGRAAA
ncbi:MAG: 2OG-Fe(II) oxygenase [Alphaproteobacteria bacterium]|nr:2OG-Fe(II) oxygenase [Alphaproteobacteria bacterium]